jgi:hypothetical protein|tara:strand:- start:76 stop:423 length:348 start_codon:yes stop_codon:yes gene_type:complete
MSWKDILKEDKLEKLYEIMVEYYSLSNDPDDAELVDDIRQGGLDLEELGYNDFDGLLDFEMEMAKELLEDAKGHKSGPYFHEGLVDEMFMVSHGVNTDGVIKRVEDYIRKLEKLQ